MERREFLARAGLLTVVGAAGTGAGLATEKAISAAGPSALAARPSGPGAYATIVTFRTEPPTNLVALTIDDGPTPEWTPQVLAVLRRRGANATFFRVGQRAHAAPDLVMRTADNGHEQGNHTWAHDDLTQHGEAFDRDTLERTHELLAKLTGRPPTLCRPPYGRIDNVGLVVCAGLRYGVTLWSHHITGSNASRDVDATLRQASPGSIVLAHDGGPEPNTSLMQQLDRLVASLTDAGYRFVTVSELLAFRAEGAPKGAALNAKVAPEPA
jgi:peptidoglycan-N-acetylglucosamine deacetylase